jgi:effector-binding domain-containing protein
MEPAYDGLTKWRRKHGYEAAGPAIEYYFNDPNEVGMENAHTEIHLPLK